MPLFVHYLRALDKALVADLQARLQPEIRLTTGVDSPAPAGYQVLVAGRPGREHLAASPNLQILVIPWSGLPEETRRLVAEFPHVAVHNLHYNALPVAEHVLALLLAAAKRLLPTDRALRAHDWTPRYSRAPSLLLAGRTALIVGYGAIGRRVARLLQGLGMEILAVRRRSGAASHDGDGGIRCAPPEHLHRLLPRAQVLVVCVPHTAETTGLIGARELALLPPDAILVNVSRGPVVDEEALYHALRDGSLFGAGLDVWYHYPAGEADRAHTPPATLPFHELENVVMSPHRAGHAAGRETLRMADLADLLNAAARGEPVPNPVDLEAGY